MTEEAARRFPDPVVCPDCGATAGLAIAYGMPTHEVIDAAQDGRIALGGCVIDPGQPDYRCGACGHQWIVDEDGNPSLF